MGENLRQQGFPMAYVSQSDLRSTVRAQMDRFFASIGQGFNAYLVALSRSEQVETLMGYSDEQLARLGITRDRIVEYVFRDRMGY